VHKGAFMARIEYDGTRIRSRPLRTVDEEKDE